MSALSSFFRLAAAPPPPYPNPGWGAEDAHRGPHWFHGTEYHPDHDATRYDGDEDDPEVRHDPGGRLTTPERGAEPDEDAKEHWNTDLGVHFSSIPSVAERFATGNGRVSRRPSPNSRIAHAFLHMANPKVYGSEYDMAREAVQVAHEHGLHYLDDDVREHPDTEDHLDSGGRYSDLPDHEHLEHVDNNSSAAERRSLDMVDRGDEDQPHEAYDQYLALHPRRDEVVHAYKSHLEDQGHDGIVYGNEYEPPKGHPCAIAFEPDQIHIRHWQWLHPDKAHLNRNGAAPEYDEHQPPLVDRNYAPEHGHHWVGPEGQRLSMLMRHFAAAGTPDDPILDTDSTGLPEGTQVRYHAREAEDGRPKEHFLYAHIPGKMGPLGFPMATRDVGHLWWYDKGPITHLQTHPDYQRQGVATELMRRARAIDPEMHHSDNLMPDGAKWLEYLQQHHPHLAVSDHWLYRGSEYPDPEVDRPRLYHGTNAELAPGDHIEPGRASNFPEAHEGDEGDHLNFVHATPDVSQAWMFADHAVHHGRQPGGKQHVYEVEPTGRVLWGDEAYPEDFDDDHDMRQRGTRMSDHPFRVVGEVPYSGEHLEWSHRKGLTYQAGANGDLPDLTFEHGNFMESPLIHEVRAFHQGQDVGHIHWWPQGRVMGIGVAEPYRRRGVATALWEQARQRDPKIRHSLSLTEDGQAFRNSFEAKDRRSYLAIREERRSLRDYEVSDRQFYHGGGWVSLHDREGNHVGDFKWTPNEHGVHEVKDVWIHPDHRGYGLGHQMKQHAEQKFGVSIEHSQERTEKGDRWAQQDGASPVADHVLWDDLDSREGSRHAAKIPAGMDHGIFSPTKTTLDPVLWDKHDRLHPIVARTILDRLDKALSPEYPDWHHWCRVYFAGGEASYWWGGSRDFDTLIGVNYAKFRRAHPDQADLSDDTISVDITALFRARFNDDHYVAPWDGQEWSITAFVNPNSWNIRDIKPYSAYRIDTGKWVVKPPQVPADWSAAAFSPAMWGQVEDYLHLVHHIEQIPDPRERARRGAMLYTYLHDDRRHAFGPDGLGWADPSNAIWKALEYAKSDPVAKLVSWVHQNAEYEQQGARA